MQHIELNGQVREASNKAAVKAVRRAGLVPCNIYGHGMENILFTIDAQDLKTITHTPNSFIIDLKLSDGRSGYAVLHEVQYHPVSDEALHAGTSPPITPWKASLSAIFLPGWRSLLCRSHLPWPRALGR